LLFAERDELGYRLGRHGRVYDHHVRHQRNHRYRRKILFKVIVQLGVQGLGDRLRDRDWRIV